MIRVYNGSILNSNADVIGHQCNCKGAMGKGVALCIKNAYPEAYRDYKGDYRKGLLKLGYVGFSKIGENRYVANMCGQDDYYCRGSQKTCLTDYRALETCFKKTCDFMKENGLSSIAFPYFIGCGLAGGNWDTVFRLINTVFDEYDVELWKI